MRRRHVHIVVAYGIELDDKISDIDELTAKRMYDIIHLFNFHMKSEILWMCASE